MRTIIVIINTFQFTNSSRLVQPNINCKHDVPWARWSALKIDPWIMARSCSQKLSNSWPIQKNGLKTWTDELLDMVWTLAIAPLTWVSLVTSSALQSRKWQLIGMSQLCRSALCGYPLPALTDNWTHGAVSGHTIAPISHTKPSPRSRSY